MTRTFSPDPLPHRSGRRLLPVMAAFFWAVALHVAVAAGLAGLSGESTQVDASPRGFKLVQTAVNTQATETVAKPETAHPAPEEPAQPPVQREPDVASAAAKTPPAAEKSPEQKPVGKPVPDTKAPSPGLKRRVAQAPPEKTPGSSEPPEAVNQDSGEAAAQPHSSRNRPNEAREPTPPPQKQPERAPEAKAARKTTEGGQYQPPGVPSGYRANPSPAYPSRARRRGIEGTVLLKVRVGPDGRPMEVRIQRSSGHTVLDRAARDAVRDWSFRPASRGGKKVAGSVKVPIRFRLAGR